METLTLHQDTSEREPGEVYVREGEREGGREGERGSQGRCT